MDEKIYKYNFTESESKWIERMLIIYAWSKQVKQVESEVKKILLKFEEQMKFNEML